MMLLTDEELSLAIRNAISDWAMSDYKDGWGGDAMAQDNYWVIRKAQLKKVVQWGELYCQHDNGGSSIKSWACPICRQALLKEVNE